MGGLVWGEGGGGMQEERTRCAVGGSKLGSDARGNFVFAIVVVGLIAVVACLLGEGLGGGWFGGGWRFR